MPGSSNPAHGICSTPCKTAQTRGIHRVHDRSTSHRPDLAGYAARKRAARDLDYQIYNRNNLHCRGKGGSADKKTQRLTEEPRIKQRCWNNSSRRRLTFQPMKTKGFADRIQTRSETFVSTTPSRLKTQRSELTDVKDAESPVSIGALTKETGRRRSSEN
jgi:hypothetical protein